MRRRSRVERQKAEIGMNSLIDLTFLLLVTFIVTLPALEQGISIMLPQAKTDQLPTKDKKANGNNKNNGNGERGKRLYYSIDCHTLSGSQ